MPYSTCVPGRTYGNRSPRNNDRSQLENTMQTTTSQSAPLALRAARFLQFAAIAAILAAAPVARAADRDDERTYDRESVMQEATNFFGESTEGLAKVIEKVFQEQGRPNGFIRGREGSGAVTVGLRYGDGELVMKNGATRKVYWRGPSIGFDIGGNGSKVFVLVYHLPNTEKLYMRFPSVDGSLYYVAGVGVNYQRRGGIVLAPIRLGVGLRAGASIGYMHYSKRKSLNPF